MTEHLPISKLLKAIYTRLGTDLTPEVFDYVDPKREMPYVSLGAPQAVSNGSKTQQICDITIPFDIWTNYRGMKEFTDLAEALVVSITKSDLDLSADGYHVVRTRFDSMASDKNFDGAILVQHAVLTFTWKVQKVS